MTRQINLYNPALRLQREWLTGKTFLGAVVLLLLALGLRGTLLWLENRQLGDDVRQVSSALEKQQAELARLNEEISQRKVSKEAESTLRNAEAALQGREQVREALSDGELGSSGGFSSYLKAFARQARDGLWMVGLQLSEGGRNIALEGRTTQPDEIPLYIRGLNEEPTLRGRSFAALNVRRVGTEDKPAAAPAPGAPAEKEQDTQKKLPPYHEFHLSASAPDAATAAPPATQRRP